MLSTPFSNLYSHLMFVSCSMGGGAMGSVLPQSLNRDEGEGRRTVEQKLSGDKKNGK